jgi:pseudomonalisin
MKPRAPLAAALAAAAGPMIAFGLAGPAQAATTGWSATATQAVPALNGATAIGQLAGSTPVHVTLGLALRNQATLDNFIADASTPSSAEFGAQYTPQGFAAAYGPTTASVDAVTSYLESQGFTDVTASSNNLLVSASGTAAEADQAFHTTLTEYSLGGADVYANSAAAMVPSSLSGTVVGVLGLNDVFKATPTPMQAKKASTTPTLFASYTPQGFQKAYGATGTATGAGTTIATISAAKVTAVIKNLRFEESANKLPQVPVTVEYAGPANPTTTATANVEWDLDSQFSSGMAQSVSHYYFYDAASLTDSTLALDFNKWASQDLAKAASASLGECEFEAYLDGSMVIDDEVFAEAAAQGQTMFASSGDTGAACSVGLPNGVPDGGAPFVNYPASSRWVVGVGGTTLTTKSTGAYDLETSWVAGGGGISQFEYRPYWQAQVMPVTAGTTGDRGVPDIAMDANPTTGAHVYTGSTTPLYSTGGWEGVGGTSLSAPLALGTWARIESAYGNRLGYAAPVLYGVYLKGSCNATLSTTEQICTTPAFHAPVAGFNGLYPETPGYNYDTGLGTFDTSAMVTAVKPFVPAAVRKPGPGAPPPPGPRH